MSAKDKPPMRIPTLDFVAYDNEGLSRDRYTVFLVGFGKVSAVRLSVDCDKPEGMSRFWVPEQPVLARDFPTIGKRVEFLSLPERVRRHAFKRLCEESK